MTSTTSAIASTSVISTSRIDSSTTCVVLKAIWYFMPGGKSADSRSISALTSRSTSSALAVGSWMTPNPTASKPWKRSDARVGLGAELGAADVAQPHQPAAGARLDDDVLELADLGQPPRGADADLVALTLARRRLADAAGRHLDVLLAQRVDHVAGGDRPGRQPVGIEPDAHRILALAEDEHLADAGEPLERVLDVDVDVVAHEQRVVLPGLAVDPGAEHEVRRRLLDGDAGGADLGRHPAERLVHAVLHVDRRQVHVARDVEGHGDLRHAGVGARRGHVEHALDAVDRLLERRGDRRFDGLGVGPRVERRHGDLRRRQLRILRHRHRRDRDGAGEDDDERADRREDRPADEGVDHGGQQRTIGPRPAPRRRSSGCRTRSPGRPA